MPNFQICWRQDRLLFGGRPNERRARLMLMDLLELALNDGGGGGIASLRLTIERNCQISLFSALNATFVLHSRPFFLSRSLSLLSFSFLSQPIVSLFSAFISANQSSSYFIIPSSTIHVLSFYLSILFPFRILIFLNSSLSLSLLSVCFLSHPLLFVSV